MTDWKPGDVALVTNENGVEWRAIARPRQAADGALEFVYTTGGFDMVDDLAEGYTARPLVVIDPESPKDQRRLLDLLRSSGAFRGVVSQDIALDCIGDALREFANPKPPKPDEPTGLGAVVEDAAGDHWIRCRRSGHQGLLGVEWENERTCAHNRWPNIDAVYVRDEGWTE